MTSPTAPAKTVAQWADEVMDEIRADIEAGRFGPDVIQGFSDLHDFVDANMYGDEIPDDDGEEWFATRQEVYSLVDTRLKAGEHHLVTDPAEIEQIKTRLQQAEGQYDTEPTRADW